MTALEGAILTVHVPAGIIATASGVTAMLSAKGGETHRRAGRIYLGALAVVCVTGFGLVATRWPRFPHLLALGALAGALATAGYRARRIPRQAFHLAAMGGSYIVMLTAFYVDNGPRLPLWRLLPPIALWLVPSLIGVPIIVRAARRRLGPRQP